MNIAFPAFLIFLLLLPGFIFQTALRNQENTQLDHQPFTKKVIASVLTTFLVHFVWILIFIWLFNYDINFAIALDMIALTKDEYSHDIQLIANNFISISSYFISLYIFSWFTGYFLHYLIVRFNWDEKTWLRFIFRLESEWYYLFKGYDRGKPDSMFIAATIEFAGQGYIYSGILEDFILDQYGNMDRLVITDAQRRFIGNDKNKCDQEIERFYPIDGDYFVLKYSEIRTLNVSFIKLEKI